VVCSCLCELGWDRESYTCLYVTETPVLPTDSSLPLPPPRLSINDLLGMALFYKRSNWDLGMGGGGAEGLEPAGKLASSSTHQLLGEFFLFYSPLFQCFFFASTVQHLHYSSSSYSTLLYCTALHRLSYSTFFLINSSHLHWFFLLYIYFFYSTAPSLVLLLRWYFVLFTNFFTVLLHFIFFFSFPTSLWVYLFLSDFFIASFGSTHQLLIWFIFSLTS
jgi:hypothetical protein